MRPADDAPVAVLRATWRLGDTRPESVYLDPPQHCVVFSSPPGRAERHGFEYYRHGTLSLYAALNTQTGEVLGSAGPRHTSDEFVAFLTSVVEPQPRRREIHIIVDDLRS